MKLEEKQKIEIDFWKNSVTENPESDSIDNIIGKIAEAAIFLDCLRNFENVFAQSKTILELGGGQGWASSIVKKIYPEISVTLTDISEFAIASAHKWEHIFQVKIDEKLACKSYDIPKEDSSYDCIFVFAAAHHFVAHQKTLKEIKRVLTPGGHCFYFYEPSCIAYLHKMAHWRVNRKRPEVPEDVLVYKQIQTLASEAGLDCSLNFYPNVIHRGAFETIYYSVLNKSRLLQRLLPCTINYHFTSPK